MNQDFCRKTANALQIGMTASDRCQTNATLIGEPRSPVAPKELPPLVRDAAAVSRRLAAGRDIVGHFPKVRWDRNSTATTPEER